MKNALKISFLLSCLFLLSIVSGQEEKLSPTSLNLDSQLKEKELPRKYRAIVLGIGLRGISTDPGEIVTTFVDDSPSMDSFSSTETIEDYQNRIGIQLEWKFGFYRGISQSVIIDGAIGNGGGGAFGYTIGYNIPVEIGNNFLHVRPNLAAMVGNTRILLGRIQNNAGYIQINNTQFYDSQLNVKLNSSSYILRPGADFLFDISNKIHLFANLSYDFGGQVGDPDLYFESLSGASDQQTASKDLGGVNSSVVYNGAEITELPYDLNGIRFTIGAAFVWTKN